MEIMDDVKYLVEAQGDAVRQGTKECKDWRLTHENCFGCPYELGCGKSVSIGLTILSSNEFNGDKIQETMDKLLAAKSTKELMSIHIPEMEY